jgi:pentatricopeptide repeat protein
VRPLSSVTTCRAAAVDGFVEPDDVVFAVLIRGLGRAKSPPDWAAVGGLLTRMQRDFGLPASVTVYNALLELCALSNDTGRAEELLERMAAEGVEPDVWTEKAVEGKRALRTALRRTFA